MMPEHKILAGTFHKTGTVLLRNILKAISEEFSLRFWEQGPEPADGWDIRFHGGSNFRREMAYPHRGVIIIRDPRDVIISAAHFHGRGREGWLHKPDERFGGMTYLEKINSLPNDDERYLFEMDNFSRQVILDMVERGQQRPNFLIVKFEDLVTDVDLLEYKKIFEHLGFPQSMLTRWLEIATRYSLFSGQVRPHLHVRSGKPAEWREKLSPRVLAAFRDRFGDAAEKLGYESAESVSEGSPTAQRA